MIGIILSYDNLTITIYTILLYIYYTYTIYDGNEKNIVFKITNGGVPFNRRRNFWIEDQALVVFVRVQRSCSILKSFSV